MLVVTRAGAAAMLTELLGQALTLRLFASDTEITRAREPELTEAAGAGYAPITLAPDGWILDSDGYTARHARQTFSFRGPCGPLYGYYVTDARGRVRWAERLPRPFFAEEADDSVSVTPVFGL